MGNGDIRLFMKHLKFTNLPCDHEGSFYIACSYCYVVINFISLIVVLRCSFPHYISMFCIEFQKLTKAYNYFWIVCIIRDMLYNYL